ncbi:unnamed protein product, partial [Ixodes persulcatus]
KSQPASAAHPRQVLYEEYILELFDVRSIGQQCLAYHQTKFCTKQRLFATFVPLETHSAGPLHVPTYTETGCEKRKYFFFLMLPPTSTLLLLLGQLLLVGLLCRLLGQGLQLEEAHPHQPVHLHGGPDQSTHCCTLPLPTPLKTTSVPRIPTLTGTSGQRRQHLSKIQKGRGKKKSASELKLSSRAYRTAIPIKMDKGSSLARLYEFPPLSAYNKRKSIVTKKEKLQIL